MDFFQKNLKYLREKNNLTRSELAKKLKINQSTLSRWESGEMGCTVGNAYDIANFFNISISDLIDTDLSLSNNSFQNELDVLFSKNRKYFTKDDEEMIKFVIEKRKREIDKELNREYHD